MKTNAFILLLMLLTLSIYSQNISAPVETGRDCDTLFWTSTEYPVRLINDISDIQKELSQRLTIYPEDLETTINLTYRFTITCAGINIGSSLASYEGPQRLGLSKRIITILDEICTWSPAMQSESRVNSFYHLIVNFNKGKIDIIPQNKSEQ